MGSQMNPYIERTDNKFIVWPLEMNATVDGVDYGVIVLEYDENQDKLRVRFLAAADDDPDTEALAESAEIAASSLPATVALVEVGGSGVSGSITIKKVRT